MICNSCGCPNAADRKFCGGCGKTLVPASGASRVQAAPQSSGAASQTSIICNACGCPNDAGRNFCGGCGAALAVACPSCGAPHRVEERYCGACGKSLDGAKSGSAGASQPSTLSAGASSSAAQSPMPTSIAGGRYRVLRLLGEGRSK